MHKLLYYLCLSVCYAGITYALPDGEIIGREVELKTCQTIGKSLINLCVINPAPDPKTCTPLYAGYVACITKLNSPRPLEVSQ